MSVLLVGNPSAQSGKNAERVAIARKHLDPRHVFLATLPAGGTVGAVERALGDQTLDTIIAMGGDGTFAEVAKGLIASGRAESVRLGMIPTGTANDQGKSFGLSATTDAIADNVAVIRDGYETRLDVGAIECDGYRDFFFDSAGIGISPRVLALRNEDRHQIEQIPVVRDVLRDHLVYAGALFKTFLASYVQDQKFDAVAVVDGETTEWKGLTDLIIKGTRIYGGMWVFDPTSRHDDGEFEVIPFLGKRDWTSKALLHLEQTGVLADTLEKVGVTHSQLLRGARIELTLTPHDEPLFAQIDGEELAIGMHVRVEVRPRMLRLIVPKEYAIKE